MAHPNLNIFFFSFGMGVEKLSKLLDFSRQLFWVLANLCYLQNWMFCPITPFKMVRFETLLHKKGFSYITILSTNNLVVFKLNVLPHSSIPIGQIWNIPLQTAVILFETIILSTNNPMLSSKLNVLSHSSIPIGQIWNIPLQTAVILFETIILSTNNSILSSKLNVLSHNFIPIGQIWNIPSQTGVIFWDNHFEYQQFDVIFKIEHFVP